ncbi:MAG: TIGR04211 family SH3 domain-containing protein [Myxococcota bacterium]|nr:TIGR04211 family SH3 domain-containing protein [Myxococcota bacterium]
MPLPSFSARAALLSFAILLLVSAALLVPSTAWAERAWVGSQIQLNLRTGPGTEYRIVGTVETGDRVSILERKPQWTRVRIDGGSTGWVPVGYLEPSPPPVLELAQLRKEAAQLRQERDEAESSRSRLEEAARSNSASHAEQSLRIEELTRVNTQLEAGARWPEWITGAGILCVGLALGALLHRASSRRRQGTRIRL